MHFTISIRFIAGTSILKRNTFVQMLNLEYNNLLKKYPVSKDSYAVLVQKHPPRYLSSWTYGAAPKPLRSARRAELPAETDVTKT